MRSTRSYLGLAAPIGAVVLPLAACSLTLGEGYSSGRPLGAEDAAAGTEAGTNPSSDAGADAGGLGFCASRQDAVFCDDFEDPLRPFQQLWAPANPAPSVRLVLAADRRASPLHSLLIDVPVGTPASSASLSHTVDWDGTRSEVTVEMSLFIEAFPAETTLAARFLPIYFDAPPTAELNLRLRVDRNADGNLVLEQEEVVYPIAGGPGSFRQQPIAPEIPSGRWTRLSRTVKLGASPAVTLSVDGVLASVLPLRSEFVPVRAATVHLGSQYVEGLTSGFKVWTDDVVVVAK